MNDYQFINWYHKSSGIGYIELTNKETEYIREISYTMDRPNPYISSIRHQYQIGDILKINPEIVGVTSIDRNKVYTIDQFFDKRPCSIFKYQFSDEYCMRFKELPNNYFILDNYWILVQKAYEPLDNELFIL